MKITEIPNLIENLSMMKRAWETRPRWHEIVWIGVTAEGEPAIIQMPDAPFLPGPQQVHRTRSVMRAAAQALGMAAIATAYEGRAMIWKHSHIHVPEDQAMIIAQDNPEAAMERRRLGLRVRESFIIHGQTDEDGVIMTWPVIGRNPNRLGQPFIDIHGPEASGTFAGILAPE